MNENSHKDNNEKISPKVIKKNEESQSETEPISSYNLIEHRIPHLIKHLNKSSNSRRSIVSEEVKALTELNTNQLNFAKKQNVIVKLEKNKQIEVELKNLSEQIYKFKNIAFNINFVEDPNSK